MRAGPIRIADRMKDPEFVASLPKSRAEAAETGSLFYISAKRCPKNHESYRITKNGSCAQCASDISSIAAKAWAKTEAGKESRAKTTARWNSTEGAKTAKDRWKARDPKWAWVVSAVGAARTRAKFLNLPFDLTNEYILSILPEACPVLGVTLSFGGTSRPVPNSASIDKIVPSLGYTKGNVAVISYKANAIKSNATADEIERVAKWLRAIENGRMPG